MTRVLLVYQDQNVADVEGDALRQAGYEVDRCAGPIGGEACPVLSGRRCWQVDKADVLVYDTWDADLEHAQIIEDLLVLHADKPLVLTSPVSPQSFTAARRTMVRSIPVAGSRAALPGAIERALQLPPRRKSRRVQARREPPSNVGAHW